METLETILIVAVLASLFYLSSRLSRRRRMGVRVIESPVLGFLDLSGGAAREALAEDKAGIAPLFSSVIESAAEHPPQCDVLFLYCHLEHDGRIKDSDRSVRDIIQDSGATVVVLAQANDRQGIVAVAKDKTHGLANLVLISHRKNFVNFFSQLFSEMKKGTSMPAAWVKLAPQIPGREDPDVPDSLCLIEAGQIAFR